MTQDASADQQVETPPTLTQKLLAEFLGTFVLVFIGCGAAVMTGADVASTGLAFGIAIVMMAYAFGRISGGHFNPAVSVGAALAGRISWKETGLYSVAQTAGALHHGVAIGFELGGIEVAVSVHPRPCGVTHAPDDARAGIVLPWGRIAAAGGADERAQVEPDSALQPLQPGGPTRGGPARSRTA